MEMESTQTGNKNASKEPRQEPSFLSTSLFFWTIPLLLKGFRTRINAEDLLQPLKSQKTRRIGKILEESWNKESVKNKDPSLWRAFSRQFGLKFVGLSIVYFVNESSKLVQTLALGQLMLFYMSDSGAVSENQAYMYTSVIAGITIFNTLLQHNFLLRVHYLGMEMKIAASWLIYQKSLRLRRNALNEQSVGKIVNLLSNDINRFDSGFVNVPSVFFTPIIAAICVYIMYAYVGLTACAGFLGYLLLLPIQVYLAGRVAFYRLRTAIRTDRRVRFMNEIISGIKVIKMYTWEKPFANIAAKLRELEMKEIRGFSYVRSVVMSLSVFASRFSVFLSVLVYVLLGNTINAYYVFVVSSLLRSMKTVGVEHLSRGLVEWGELDVAVERIRKMLLAEEIDCKVQEKFRVQSDSVKVINDCSGAGICLKNVNAKWSRGFSENTLAGVDLTVKAGELVAIIGSVGSGKSNLLQAILQEMLITQGTVEVKGSVSYAAQEPWIFTGTVRQNILFGQEMNTERYEAVLRVCALERDFEKLPYGDNTLVGERGALLSEGQKTRIGIARAVYKEADIYLLDDPLSAVDTHVGNQLFEECIKGFLKGKCVIVVTHLLRYLGNVDKVVIMENGKVAAEGTYENLQRQEYFGNLLVNKEKAANDNDEEVADKYVKIDDKVDKTYVREYMSPGQIQSKVYKAYIKSGGGICLFTTVIIIFIATQILGIIMDYFTTFWLNLQQDKENDDTNNWKDFFTTSNCLYIYSAIAVTLVGMTLFRSFSFFYLCMKSSTKLHNKMLTKIVYASMFFFNTNPSGRILNRFSKDMGAIDEWLPLSFGLALQVGLTCFGTLIMTIVANYWLIFPVILLSAVMFLMRKIYMATSQSVKRMEAVCKSPVFTHLNATLLGATTIRAFGVQEFLKKEFDHYHDIYISAYYTFVSCLQTFSFWTDVTMSIYVVIVSYSFLLLQSDTKAGNVGLAITQALTLSGAIQFGLRQLSEFENHMTAVERVVEYADLEAEDVDEGKTLRSSWPEEGKLEFRSVWLKYTKESPYVLRNLNFSIESREKVGIVGRTGAGKSSLIAALFLLNDIEGDIIIDDMSTKEIKLHLLRSKISIIPQDPVLFSGSLRRNLDPFQEYPDYDLWNALEEVKLKQLIKDLPNCLEYIMPDGGINFSVGQRQLLCLARAMLRKNKILVMDEVTASVDNKTDELIQETIRRNFADCTVLTIAHRLHTVMDSDRVLVMDEGRVVQFDHPHLLLQKEDGVFNQLVQQTGPGMAEYLMNVAEENFYKTVEHPKLDTKYLN